MYKRFIIVQSKEIFFLPKYLSLIEIRHLIWRTFFFIKQSYQYWLSSGYTQHMKTIRKKNSLVIRINNNINYEINISKIPFVKKTHLVWLLLQYLRFLTKYNTLSIENSLWWLISHSLYFTFLISMIQLKKYRARNLIDCPIYQIIVAFISRC